ncbi:hypothetical protein Tco_1069580 [Tanacetum coccineum]|uniref:Reverse transcriptase domain-containing protein n=1 Tax=Tanacetum coccineum TaxID=301880 RepID=A0ABQ5HL70_9ASTR
MKTIHVQFDELTEHMAPVHLSTRPKPNLLTPGEISLGLVPNLVPVAPYVPPTNKDLEILFQPMFDEYFEPPIVERPFKFQLFQSIHLRLQELIKMHRLQVIHRHPQSTSPISQQGVAQLDPTIEDNL